MEKETKHTPEHFKVIKSVDGYCLGYIDDGSMEHFVAERIYNKAYADLFASAPTLKAENEKLKEAHNLEMRAAHTLRAELSEMKKEREELVKAIEGLVGKAATDLLLEAIKNKFNG